MIINLNIPLSDRYELISDPPHQQTLRSRATYTKRAAAGGLGEPWMADIQSSLRRLQESIRGLSDASALVGAVNLSEDGDEQPLVTSAAAASPAGSLASSRAGRRRTASSSTSAFDDVSGQVYHRHRDDMGEEISAVGGSARQDEQQAEGSFLSSIPRDLRESAEVMMTRKFLNSAPSGAIFADMGRVA